MHNFLVSQDTHCSKLWMVHAQRHGVSATVWETIKALGFHRTAKGAREALEAKLGGRLTAWHRTTGRGCATYRAQDYTGPRLDGVALRERSLAAFDLRYIVERAPQWHIADRHLGCIEAGPFASERAAREALDFMRQHVSVLSL